MRNLLRLVPALLALLVVAALLTPTARGSQGSGYTLSWGTITIGGGSSLAAGADGTYGVSGSAGQLDAGLLAGGGYSLEGGIWHAVPASLYRQFLPLVYPSGS
jgi:hypothetical protein